MNNTTQWLDWDSDVLGIKVAKLIPATFSVTDLHATLETLAADGAKLVYWASDSDCLISQEAARVTKGYLADQKVTYFANVDAIQDDLSALHLVEEYPDNFASEDLVHLAYLSGLYSRFKLDPNISQSQFEKIYRLWITNSVTKQIAYKVLTVKKNGRLAGMITLGEKQGRGDIGLLAVNPEFQGLKIGATLIAAAKKSFAMRYQTSQVVTQVANMPACRLYERCGYKKEKVEHFYHFWL